MTLAYQLLSNVCSKSYSLFVPLAILMSVLMLGTEPLKFIPLTSYLVVGMDMFASSVTSVEELA
jgi:hypothetical protein